jgi:hypothetical protein
VTPNKKSLEILRAKKNRIINWINSFLISMEQILHVQKIQYLKYLKLLDFEYEAFLREVNEKNY